MGRSMISMLLLLAAAPADDVRFASAGTVVPGGQIQLTHNTFHPPGGRAFTAMSAFLGPEIDYFVLDDFSIGAGIGLGGTAHEGSTHASVGLRLGVGYYLALSDDVGLYPRVGLSVGWARSSWDAPDDQVDSSRNQSLSGTVYAPMLYHSGHFFIGMGPSMSKVFFANSTIGDQTTDGGTSTSIAIATTIGGWF